MKIILNILIFALIFFIFSLSHASLSVGIAKADITPPIGTPSAGYADRQGKGMEGMHDPLLALSLFIDNGSHQIVFCSVDHLGFTYEMVQEIRNQIHQKPELKNCKVYIGSSHTHSGGGSFLNIPLIGETLAGPYNQEITQFYVSKVVNSIIQASNSLQPAKIGIGYGKINGVTYYRSSWPQDIIPPNEATLIKITKSNDSPLAVLFNFAIHPTTLPSTNRLFSADIIGYTRNHLNELLGLETESLFFNGAQGDINPIIFKNEDRFESSNILGEKLAQEIAAIWNHIEVSENFEITSKQHPYSFIPTPNPFGFSLPLEQYQTEMNLLVLNNKHAFITIPGELSCIYDKHLKNLGKELGYSGCSILGLTNDSHGYIILPESWRKKTNESKLSFGGENYGEMVFQKACHLLKLEAPLTK